MLNQSIFIGTKVIYRVASIFLAPDGTCEIMHYPVAFVILSLTVRERLAFDILHILTTVTLTLGWVNRGSISMLG